MRRRWLALLAGLLVAIAAFAGVRVAVAQSGYAVGIAASTRSGVAPLAVTFRLQLFTQSGGRFTAGTIDFGDGSAARDVWRRGSPLETVSHSYARPGTFTVRLAMTTADSGVMDQTVRIRVRAAREADPAELLSAAPATGEAPFEAAFRIGGASLPFVATGATLDFGDGTTQAVTPLTAVTHRYEHPGTYAARLTVRGRDQNLARAGATVTVVAPIELALEAAPIAGIAPMEVTLRATIPSGAAARAEIRLDGTRIADAPGTARHLLERAGTYTFSLVATTASGEERTREATVRVFEESIAGIYAHDGGVVEIAGGGGAFEGIMRAPTRAQAEAGYDIGRTLVRGAYADVARVLSLPGLGDDAGEERIDVLGEAAQRLAEGEYLVLSPNCPDQWADYRYRIDFGQRATDGSGAYVRPPSLIGPVTYAEYMQRYERFYTRLGQPIPRPGIVGRVQWVAAVIAAMQAGGEEGGPEDCVTGDNATETRIAEFRRIDAAEARRMAEANIAAVQQWARHAYDGLAPPRDDGTLRAADPVGEALASGDPVHLHSGELVVTEEDVHLAGRGLDWRFLRTYRSQSRELSALGWGWTHADQHDLIAEGDGYRLRLGGDGWSTLSPLAAGVHADPSGRIRLIAEDDARLVRDRAGRVYRFEPVPGLDGRYRAASVEDPSGNRIFYAYDVMSRLETVTDTLGRAIRWDYSGEQGLLAAIRFPDGRRLAFRHDDGGRLTRVDLFAPGADTAARSFAYAYRGGEETDPDLRHNLTAIWSPDDRGGAGVDIRYGEDPALADFDRVVWQRVGAAEEAFSYSLVDGADGARIETTVTAAGRATERHRFRPDGRLASSTWTLAGGRVVASRRDYAADGSLLRTVLPLGAAVETLPYPGRPDAEELRLVPAPGSATGAVAYLIEREPLFSAVRATYGPFPGAVPQDAAAVEEKLIARTRFDYEEAAALAGGLARFGLARPEPGAGDLNGDGDVSAAAGLPVLALAPAEAAAGGDPAPLLTAYRYRAGGLPAEIARPDGSLIRFAYQDARDGRPAFAGRVSGIDPAGVERVLAGYEWDEEGRLLAIADGDGPLVAAVLDALGRPEIVIPAGEGPRRRLVHDASGRVVEEYLLTEAERLAGAAGTPFARYAYDAGGRLTEFRLKPDAEGEWIVRSFAYDPYGALRAIAAGDARWSREIDELGRVTGEGYEGIAWSGFAYDDDGRIVAGTAPGGAVTRYGYDGLGRLAFADGPAGRVEYRRDPLGRLLERRLVDPATGAGTAERYERSAAGRIAAAWTGRVAGGAIAGEALLALLRYDALGRIVGLTLGDGPGAEPVTVSLGPEGLPAVFAGAEGALAAIRRDPAGQPVAVDRPGAGRLSLSYDRFGRVAEVGQPDGSRALRTPPDADGVARLTRFGADGAAAVATTVAHDRAGRPVRITDRQGEAVLLDWTLGYDAASRLAAVVAGDRELAAFAYDAAGRLASRAFFGLGATTFAYDVPGPDGTPVAELRIDPAGTAIAIDRAGPEVTVTAIPAAGAGAPVRLAFARDGLGRLAAMERDGWAWRRTEAADGTVTETTTAPDGTLRRLLRRQDAAGRPAGVTLPSGLAVAYRIAGPRRLDLAAGGTTLQLSYAADGSLAAIAVGPVTVTRPAAAGASRSAAVSVGGSERAAWRWIYEDGRLTRVELSPSSAALSYLHDPHGRLAGGIGMAGTEDGPAPVAFAVGYDRLGNRTRLETGNAVTEYRPAGAFGYAEIGNAEAAYDAGGRLVRLGGERFAWDALGGLAEAADGARGTTVHFARDALGRVVERRSAGSTIAFIHEAAGLVGSYPDARPAREWVRDPQGDPVAVAIGGEVLVAVTGPDGSLLALVDAAGRIRERYDYGPFGTPLATGEDGRPMAMPAEALFQGHLYDPEARLYLPAARPFRPELGFLAPEPLGPFAATHPYAYALDDPATIREVDGALGETTAPADQSLLERLFSPITDAYDRATGTLQESFSDDRPEGGPADGGEPAGGSSYGSWGSYAGTTDWDAADRARRDAFKRNARYAQSRVPGEVARQWLRIDPRGGSYGRFAAAEPGIPEPPADGPRGPAPPAPARDPHALIRQVLNEPFGTPAGPEADRIRSVFDAILSQPDAALATAVPAPGGMTADPAEATAMPAPQPPPRPGPRPPLPIGGGSAVEDGPEGIGIGPGTPLPVPSPPPQRPGGLMGGLF